MTDFDRLREAPSAARRALAARLLAREGVHLAAEPGAPAARPAISAASPAAAPAAGSPGDVVKQETKQFYDGVTRQLDSSMFGTSAYFLNLGYAATLNPQRSPIALPAHAIDINSIKLVLETVGDFDLTGKRVLDVGCGRGGTIVTLLRYWSVASATGMDLSPAAVAFCRRQHRRDARFASGDSERLPFLDAAFNVVTNIESSHIYPNVQAFYREVHRVLAPAGSFLYADLFESHAGRRASIESLRGLGFDVEREDDVTDNVLLSCDQIAERRQRAFADRPDTDVISNFLAAPGSPFYDGLKSGRSGFWIYRLRRP